MKISLFSTTNDIEQLRNLALAMVQKAVCENAEKEQRIRLLEEALKLARQQRFGRKSEVLSGLQWQLFEEDVDTDIAATEVRLRKWLQPDDTGETKSASRPVRKPLPAHLPRVVKTIEPASTENCPNPECTGKLRRIRDEVSEKLEYIPARFVVNQYVAHSMVAPAASRWSVAKCLRKLSRKGMRKPAWPLRWWSANTGTICHSIDSSIFLPRLMSICQSANGRMDWRYQRGSDATGRTVVP